MSRDGEPETTIRYRFRFGSGEVREFALGLDPETLEMRAPWGGSAPAWTALGYLKCPNCPLDEARHPRCPVARNLVEVVEFLRDRLSFEEVHVTVETRGRTYSKQTSLQNAAGSLIGIYTVTSGCPVLGKMRPMVETHLPFMTSDEASYRLISMYLLAQYFLHKRGRAPDWDLGHLVELLAEARVTNAAFTRRLQSLGVQDASLNALSELNAQGEITSLGLETADLARLERLFDQTYLKD